jgi:hypothetical protein
MASPPKMPLPPTELAMNPDKYISDETRTGDRYQTLESKYTYNSQKAPEQSVDDRKLSFQEPSDDYRRPTAESQGVTDQRPPSRAITAESGFASVMQQDSYKSSFVQQGYQEQWQNKDDKKVHTVIVDKFGECNKLGLDIYVSSRDKIKKVAKVKDAGLIARHNLSSPENAVFENDGIESINGVAWPQKAFFDQIKNAQTLTLIVHRGQYND